ncbi:MAG: hypothetical protein L0206_08375 [Actinobacteria bacterium]|nr:hypothetical protein [Actinomycetota bacterium]
MALALSPLTAPAQLARGAKLPRSLAAGDELGRDLFGNRELVTPRRPAAAEEKPPPPPRDPREDAREWLSRWHALEGQPPR